MIWGGDAIGCYGAHMSDIEEYTLEGVGTFWAKRDDHFEVAGVYGGKARTCYHLATLPGVRGLVTASSRHSPQAEIVSSIGQYLGLPTRCHTPTGADTEELKNVRAAGAELVQHKPGHNSVICRRAKDDATATGYAYIPFGMECREAVTKTSGAFLAAWAGRPPGIRRLVVPVGSGMTLAGILRGMDWVRDPVPVVGVCVGANPRKRLDQWGPVAWQRLATLCTPGVPYSDHLEIYLGSDMLDPVYEAKCVRFIEAGDLFWVVGARLSCKPPF